MSKYEIDDEVVRGLIDNRDLLPPRLLSAVAALEVQIPIPTPTRIGAVVRTEGGFRGGVYLRWAHDNATHSPWIEVGDHENPHGSDAIGRIVEVLTPGLVI